MPQKIYTVTTLACLLFLAACSGKSSGTAQPAADEAAPASPVQVAVAKRGPIHQVVSAEAVLYPIRQASIVPKINAPVQRFLVQRGAHVKEGQLLAVLENRDLVAAAGESKGMYQQAQAAYETTTAATMPDDLVKAKTDVQTARAAVDAARKVYENREALLRQGALAQKLVDDAKVALVQAQSQFDTAQQHLQSLESVGQTEQRKSAQAQVSAAKAHLESAEAQVSYSEVRSPISGVISDRPLNVGEMASSSSALITIVDIAQVVARANVPVREAADVTVGKMATITGPGAELTGKVTVVSPAVDPSTTTVEVWVQAQNSSERLKPGETVHIAIEAKEIPDALLIPASALLTSDSGGDKVMVAGSDSLAHEREVKLGVREGDQVQVLSGIKDGEQVITDGALGLDDKAKIKIVSAGEGEGADKADTGGKDDAKGAAQAK